MNETTPPWEEVNDDALLQILECLDVTTAVRLLRGTSHAWRNRSDNLTVKYPDLWRIWYDRLGYSPAKIRHCENGAAVLTALATSRRLSHKLMGPSKKTKSNCFPLANRCFSFLPVAPDDNPYDDDDDSFFSQDPPPVSFDCDSFLLTGQGTELVLLNPFTLTVTVHESVLDQVFHSDEGMMEQAWRAASHRIVQQRHSNTNSSSTQNMTLDDDQEYLLAADAIHETLHRNHYVRQAPYRVDPQQTLVDLTDTVDLGLQEYFAPRRDRSRQPSVMQENDEAEEYELSYGGIDAKPVWRNGIWQGTLLALGRIVTRVSHDAIEEDCCWEVLTWYKGHNKAKYSHPRSCRFRGAYHALDVCPHQQVVYVNPCRPADNVDWGADDNIFMIWSGQRVIRAIPLTDDNVPATQTKPVAEWKCQNPVTAMVVSPCAGEVVLVSTSARTIEIYERTATGAELQQMISIPKAMTKALKRHGRPVERIHPAPVTEIFCAKDLPLSWVGFWTIQHNSVHGSTLLLWKIHLGENGVGVSWDVETILHLPLSGQRTPKIFYDGRRLLVYGQDHIGMILMVYHVRYSNEDEYVFRGLPLGKEACGGVVNVGHTVPTTRFANRIRHVALSGMENIFYEALYMTANERFVILNTKNGNLLSGSSTPYREGLIVIDLLDEET